MISLTLATARDLDAWQRFVDGRFDAGPMHHAGWFDVLNRAYSVTPYFFIARDDRDRIHGILPAYLTRNVFSGSHLTSLEGGILAETPVVADALLTEAARVRDLRKVGFLQMRGGDGLLTAPVSTATVHTVVETKTGPDELWKRLKRKTRWGVRQAASHELQVVIDTELTGLDRFYQLYAAHMHELGTPVFGFKTLVAMRDYLGRSRLRLYHLQLRDATIGGMLCVVHGNRWTNLYAIVRRAQRDPATEYANYLLYWHVMREASVLGIEEFDLGRSAPESNVHKFKQKWGGVDREVPYGYFPMAGSTGRRFGLVRENRRLGLRQRIWSLLPPPLACWLGPVIRRDLPFI